MNTTTAPLAGSPKRFSTRASDRGREEISDVTVSTSTVGRVYGNLVARSDANARTVDVVSVAQESRSLEYRLEAGMLLDEARQHSLDRRARGRDFPVYRGGPDGLASRREEYDSYGRFHQKLRGYPVCFRGMVNPTTPNGY
jgi:hypothetical protein